MSVVDRWYVRAATPGDPYPIWTYGARTRRGGMIYEYAIPAAPEYQGDPMFVDWVERKLESAIAREMEKAA